jgi:diguanylate cyclase (GGDEF)-like protein/PAS domain S-box-containing protein
MDRASGRTHLGALLPHAGSPVGALGFWLMHRADLLGPAPFWLIVVLLVSSGVLNGIAYSVSQRMAPRPARMHVRLGVGAVTTAVILYATGWGAVIAMGFVLATSDVLRTDGSRAWWRGTAWNVAAMTCGQIAIATGLAPSVLSDGVSHAVAVGNALCLVIVMYSLGTTTAATEHAKEEAANEREHFRSLVQHASDVIAVLDATDLSIHYVSPAISSLLGFEPAECAGMTIGDLVGEGAHSDAVALATALNEAGGTLTAELEVRHRDGSPRTVEVTATLRTDGTIVGNVHDVTHQRELERELRYKARHDTLTGLMNRAALIEAVERHLSDAVVAETISVLFVDLDGFKEVNDALGHERGDAVLVEAAHRIVGAVPAHALTGRLGGDEFLVVLHRTRNDEAGAIAMRILDALERPWHDLPGCEISASIGVATTGARRESVEDILGRADEAMYDAKRQGKGRYVLARAA